MHLLLNVCCLVMLLLAIVGALRSAENFWVNLLDILSLKVVFFVKGCALDECLFGVFL